MTARSLVEVSPAKGSLELRDTLFVVCLYPCECADLQQPAERYLRGAYEKCDQYAYGMVLFECLTNTRPFADAINEADIVHKVKSGEVPDIRLVPAKYRAVVEECWKGSALVR